MIKLDEKTVALLGYSNTGDSQLSIQESTTESQSNEIIVVNQNGERVSEIEEELLNYLKEF